MLTLDHLLADACSNPDVNWDVSLSLEENEKAADGWSTYRIELHCVAYTISAKKVEEGVMNQETEEWMTPPKYEIRSFTKENC